MAYARKTSDSGRTCVLQGNIGLRADGKYAWTLKEFFVSDDLTGKTGSLKGAVCLAENEEVADYDTAAAELKTAFAAAA
tara:strand:- start:1138 stop:1374 length:237 start_codon:yes stop_codon:yes gene_type:complete